MECREYKLEIKKLTNEKQDMLVLIDTLQRCLERSQNVLNGHDKYDYVFAPSATWAMNWKEGNND